MKIIKVLFIVLGVFFGISISAMAAGLVLNVADPNGSDDTANIQAALTQCVDYGPGCTVQLAAGTYLTQQLFAKDFHGTFKGKGMDVTIIQALHNLEVSQDKPIWINPPTLTNKYPMLVLFFGGNVTVSDMTIRALEMNQVQGWYDYDGQQDPFRILWGILEFMGESTMNVVVTRVALKGAYDETVEVAEHYNTAAATLAIDPWPSCDYPTPGYLSGTFRVSACRLDTALRGITATILHKAQLTIGGSPSDANVIENCAYGPWILDLDASVAEVSYNDVSVVGQAGWGGLCAFQGWIVPIETPSSILIQHNRVKVAGGDEDGIWIADLAPWYGERKWGDFVISNNDITLESSENSLAGDGIESYQTEGAIISNNRIVGRGWTGIALWEDTGAMVKGNNVNHVTAAADFLYPAPLCLMGMTNNCTVIGSGNKTNVYDEGINNTLVGVNNMQGNAPGPAVRDAMKRKIEMIKSIRRP